MAALFTTEEGGVTVTKHVETDGETVQIGLRIESARERSVTVRVLDTVPATATVQTPATDSSRWSVSEGTVAYERSLDPEASVTTGYAFTGEGEADPSDSQHPPTLDVTDGAARDEADTVTTYTEDSHVAPADRDEFAMPDDEVSVTEMVAEPTAGGAGHSTGTRTTADGSEPAPGPDRREATSDGGVADLVETILETLDADASAAQRDRLAKELDDILGPRSSLELRVMYLQSRFQALATYIDAMEAFLDDHGTAEDVLTEVLDELHAVREQLEAVHDEQATLDARLEAIEDRTDRLDSALEHRTDVVESDMQQLEERLEAIETTQGTIQSQVEQFTEFRDAFQEAVRGESLSRNHE